MIRTRFRRVVSGCGVGWLQAAMHGNARRRKRGEIPMSEGRRARAAVCSPQHDNAAGRSRSPARRRNARAGRRGCAAWPTARGRILTRPRCKMDQSPSWRRFCSTPHFAAPAGGRRDQKRQISFPSARGAGRRGECPVGLRFGRKTAGSEAIDRGRGRRCRIMPMRGG